MSKDTNEKIIRSLLMVKATVHAWTGGSTDSDASSEYATSKGADTDRFKMFVQYMPPDMAKRISDARKEIRSAVNLRTLPFKDGGWRVLLAENYLELMDAVSAPNAAYESVTKEVLSQYDLIVAEAQRSLAKGFKPEFLPTAEALERKFWVDIRTEPVLSSDDIRVEGLTEAAAEMVRASVESSVSASIELATKSMADSLYAMVTEVIRKIDSATEGNDVVFGKLVNHARVQCSALSDLNIRRDPAIAAVIEKVRKFIVTSHLDSDSCSGWAGRAARKQATKIQDEIMFTFK